MEIKKALWSLITIIVVGLIAYFVWGVVMYSSKETKPSQGESMCTLDAMQCPDGTWIGRSGPHCTFTCPTTTSSSGVAKIDVNVQAKLGEKVQIAGLTVTPVAIVEDSRCPQDVQCIQQGSVRVFVAVTSAMGTSHQTMDLNQPITTEAEAITLIAVSPEKRAGIETQSGQYQFTFHIVSR